ncbi:hypothetical protein HYPSUDRAFT_58679 [Hypholoma sublateritium FD-334 SS-4]|uniref:Fungal-type protein kinase domain-containing protein n=1 Tax=Hypholoma sublateritium (strain FD-334 SS-4) TaxID=945553 RepID=A0A0D2LXS0_HYPSF|nr:hypothetical protein HYPSUDRAFT_58679 [Hypholoma sublateritium FD-334 SS-4]
MEWALVLVDRSGIISASQFSFSSASGVTLAMIIYCFGYGRPHDFGIDESMTTPTPGKKQVKRIFEVIRPLHVVVTLTGWATQVWLVRRKGRYYDVLKDSWPLKSKPFSEIRHLLAINLIIEQGPEMIKKLKDIYPILVVGQELEHGTDIYHHELNESALPRVHRRIRNSPETHSLWRDKPN